MTIPLEPGAWHGSATESMWVEPLGEGRFVLENSPFYAFNISFQDVVLAAYVNGQLTFSGVHARGGHSTYRILLAGENVADFAEYWHPLQLMGCSYEEGPNKQLLSVDIPPTTDIYAAYAALEAGEHAGIWSVEEGHCGHPLAGGAPKAN
jgi:hypothetical protein